MSLMCGGGGGDGGAEQSPEEQMADEELRKMQRETESKETKVCSTLLVEVSCLRCSASAHDCRVWGQAKSPCASVPRARVGVTRAMLMVRSERYHTRLAELLGRDLTCTAQQRSGGSQV